MSLTAFLAVALNFLFFEHSWLALLVVGLLCLRVIMTKNKILIVSVFILCMLFSLRVYSWQKNQLPKQTLTKTILEKQHLLVYSDEIKINGDQLSFTAYWLEKSQKVLGYYRLKTPSEKRRFETLKKTYLWVVNGDSLPITGATNENQFDRQRFYRGKNIFLTFSVKNTQLFLPPLRLKVRFLLPLHDLRTRLKAYFATLPSPLSWYSETLILGVKTQELPQLFNVIERLGLLYLFSLSGLHVFYLVKLLRAILYPLKRWSHVDEFIIMLLLPIYLILGGASASLVRAVLMCFFSLGGKILGIKRNMLSIWASVLLIELWEYPALFYTLGAQLSYLLTLVIITQQGMKQWRLDLTLNLLSLPLVLYYTYQWNLLTFILTTSVGSLFEFLIFPLTLSGASIPFLQGISASVLAVFSKTLLFFGDISSNIVYGKPPLSLVLFWVFLVFELALVRQKEFFKVRPST